MADTGTSGKASEISFSKQGIETAYKNFISSNEKITESIKKITSAREIINSNWSGPEREAAREDSNNADQHITDANKNMANITEAYTKLNTNASKVSYNG